MIIKSYSGNRGAIVQEGHCSIFVEVKGKDLG